jgi:nitroimidazol reductase NimA-like FMN-containing flavoprotein (pyridoxamine 5'-phosphate oxidase superfamily)
MDLEMTDRTRLRRKAERGRFDWATVSAILDEGFVCHLGFVADGAPTVVPTSYGRVGHDLYVHGAAANHALRTAVHSLDVCVAVTLVDGVVLARSAFHHSLNYRSVMVFGAATKVEDADEKRRALLAIVDHVVPGRSTATRAPTDAEVQATLVLRVPLSQASAKVRAGGPVEEPEDLELPFWGGEIPLRLTTGVPVADGQSDEAVEIRTPTHAVQYRRPG